MQKYWRLISGTLLFLATLIGVFFWFEAEKEVRILCSMFRAGQPEQAVTRTLDTGNFLEYRPVTFEGVKEIIVDAPQTMGSSRCMVRFGDDSLVVSSSYTQSFNLQKAAAWLAVAGFAGMVVFQLLLAVGLPIGHLAWGGRHSKLPMYLRLVSTLSAFLFIYGIIMVLERAQIIQLLDAPGVPSTSVWILAALFGLSIIGNLNSESDTERKIMTPVATLLCWSCIVVGMAG